MTSKTNRTPAQQAPPTEHRRVRVVCISDTHELHRDLALPDGDLLIHAGDFTFWNHAAVIEDFNAWLGELPHRHKVVIPGNHDRAFHNDPRFREMITNAVLLINEGVTVCGLNVWGSPVTCDDTAFGYTTRQERASLYAGIPKDTHILVTHGPPYGILDREPGSNKREGCTELRLAVMRLRPRLHVFGHVHAGYGTCQTERTLFANAALLGWTGDIENRPIVMDITLQ